MLRHFVQPSLWSHRSLVGRFAELYASVISETVTCHIVIIVIVCN